MTRPLPELQARAVAGFAHAPSELVKACVALARANGPSAVANRAEHLALSHGMGQVQAMRIRQAARWLAVILRDYGEQAFDATVAGLLSPVWRLASGEIVRDREGHSHLHEGTSELLPQMLSRIHAGGRELIVEELDMGRVVGQTSCVCTSARDNIVYARRPGRAGLTRFVKNREAEACQFAVVILRVCEDGAYEILTAYIGHQAPCEPGDPACPNFAKSYGFWQVHALVWGAEPHISGSEQSPCSSGEEDVTCPHCGKIALWYSVTGCQNCRNLGCQHCLVSQMNPAKGRAEHFHVRC